MDRVLVLLESVLDSNKDLARKFDDLSTTVASKMSTMETKLTTANERITSLQTARRDGLISQMAPTPSSIPLNTIPHYVPVAPSRAPPGQETLVDDAITAMRRQLGLG